jgi:hypothetical protein
VVCPNGGMTLIFSDTGGVLDTPPVPSSSAWLVPCRIHAILKRRR